MVWTVKKLNLWLQLRLKKEQYFINRIPYPLLSMWLDILGFRSCVPILVNHFKNIDSEETEAERRLACTKGQWARTSNAWLTIWERQDEAVAIATQWVSSTSLLQYNLLDGHMWTLWSLPKGLLLNADLVEFPIIIIHF